MSSDVRIKTNRQGFRDVMQSPGVVDLLGSIAAQKAASASAASGLRFGHGVGISHKGVSARAAVYASSVDSRTKKPNAGLHKKQAEALSQVF